jgi:putative FmdB family regulatory protein
MPIYEYRCSKCGVEFEEWQKISDSPLDTCKFCGGSAKRLISQSTFVLKGTGWYVTDYGRGNSAPARKSSETSDNKDTSSTTSNKKESSSSGTGSTSESKSS